MLTIDASEGEGVGQVVRTALALSVALARPLTLRGIRLRQPKPGLEPQHLTVVLALAAISSAEVSGDLFGSTELTFTAARPEGRQLPVRHRRDAWERGLVGRSTPVSGRAPRGAACALTIHHLVPA
jgi:RNA 3'-terminal phosphate cyclase